MTISFSHQVRMPNDVLISALESESVILNLKSERYFGLDEVGTRILSVLLESDSIQSAYESLLAEYQVSGDELAQDLISLIQQLLDIGVVEITP